MIELQTRTPTRSLYHGIFGSRWGNSASAMLEGKATGLAIDLVNDVYAIKQNGSIHTMGEFSVDYTALFPNGVSRNANGFFFDGTYYMKDFDLSQVPGLTGAGFTLQFWMVNADNTTGSKREAFTLGLNSAGALHTFDFCQAGQTRSWQGSGGAANKYNAYSPSNINGVTTTRRAMAFKLDDVTLALDGSIILDSASPVSVFNIEFMRLGAYDEAGSDPLGATISRFVLFDGLDSNADLITNSAV